MQMIMMRGRIFMSLRLTHRTIQITLEFHLQMKNECHTGLCISYVQSSYYKVQIAMLLIQFVFDMPKLYVGSCAMHAYKLLSKKKPNAIDRLLATNNVCFLKFLRL